MSIRTPQILTDLFRDLRDRRLLIPAGALVVALLAIPLLLSSSAEEAPPIAPPSAVAADSSETVPAVLAENMSVRDYRKRLDSLKSKNPFEDQFSSGLEAAGEVGLLDPATPGGTTQTGGATGTTEPGGDPGAPVDPGVSPSPPPATEPQPSPKPETRYFTYRVDLLVGLEGDTEERRGVAPIALLPGSTKPVAAFLGVSAGGRQAVFAVSDEVSSTDGGGDCFPSATTCEYLVLEEGEERTFDYTPDSQTYRLKLQQIRRVELSRPPKVSAKP